MTLHVITYDEATDVMSCTCGNVPSADGFVSCDEETHQECEPDGYWQGRYLCQSCGATFLFPSVKAERVARDAEQAFWQFVASSYPEIHTGDLDPITTVHFRDACKAVVLAWFNANK